MLICLGLGLLPLLAGCNMIGAAAYYLGPRRMQPPEYKLTPERLAVFVDAVRPTDDNPLFARTLLETIETIFREQKVKARLVPYTEFLRLRQGHPDLHSWSVQRVGRELNAEEVLHLRVERLQLRESPDSPLLTPQVALRAKVIGTHEPADNPRLWPKEREGREVVCTRPPEEFVDMDAADRATIKLAKDTAHLVARLFYEYDLEEAVPKER